jgi:hypothetical protein
MTSKCKTTFVKNVIPSDRATEIYSFLENNIEWEEGVRSKKGFTRKAKPLRMGELDMIDEIILFALQKLNKEKNYLIHFIYLNYYANKDMWCPNHTHIKEKTHQLVISLGATRTLHVAKKDYLMENGDIILFGTALHGVPKEDKYCEGRISIAVFMEPIV